MTLGDKRARAILAVIAVAALAACAGRDRPAAGDMTVDLLGAGATFPYPLYARWFNQYATDSSVRINYESIGSGAGIDRLIEGTVDFAATDVPMSDREVARVRGARVLHIPMVLGSVALTFNLPSLEGPLRLTPDVIASVFLGEITRWNDPRMQAINASVTLPDEPLLVVHRVDESGTSFIFSDYLSTVSASWSAGPGRGRNISWPVGTGVRGNEGVAAQVKQTVGAIGFVESSYARFNRLPSARVRNAAGRFTAPAAFEMAAAAVSVLDTVRGPADLRVSIVNAPGPQAYPIASFSWLLVAPEAAGPAKYAQLLRFVEWALRDGERMARELGYEPIPATLAENVLRSLTEDTRRKNDRD